MIRDKKRFSQVGTNKKTFSQMVIDRKRLSQMIINKKRFSQMRRVQKDSQKRKKTFSQVIIDEKEVLKDEDKKEETFTDKSKCMQIKKNC